MNIPKTWVVLLALLLVGMAMVPIVSAGEQEIDKIVDIKDAESNALFEIMTLADNNPNFSNWTNATVQPVITYYDLNDEKTAYAFNVLVDNKYSGYVLTSATKDNFPILAFSHGEIIGSDPKSTYDSFAAAKEGSLGEGLTPTKLKSVYLGGLAFYNEYQLMDSKGENKGRTLVDLHTNKVVDLSNTSQGISIPVTDQEFKKFQEVQQNEIKESWNLQNMAMSNNRTVRLSTSGYSWNSLNGVPQYFWTLGCSPTAAGMVIGYYSLHGYPNLPRDTPLINELAENMGTCVGGSTWPWNIAPGINTLISHYNYYTLSATTDVIPTWSGDVNEIDSIRPFVLNMLNGGNAIGRSQAYGDHSVTCIGYTGNTGSPDQQFLEVYDTWMVSGESNYVSHFIHYNNWFWAANTYVRPS
jgi:hypothetical protein